MNYASRTDIRRSRGLATLGLLALCLSCAAGCDDTASTPADAGPIPDAGLPPCPAADEIPEGFVCVEAGTFWMGTDERDEPRLADEERHRVSITRPFLLATTEVTQEDWVALMGANPSWFSDSGEGCELEPCERRPVERISWYEALAYLNARSEDEGLEPCYALAGCTGEIGEGCEPGQEQCRGGYRCTEATWQADCTGYRLPTEAEWEYAARAGTETQTPGPIDDLAWYVGTARQRTRPVASQDLAPGGLYDMFGNVYEWTWDIYAMNYGFFGEPDVPVEDPTGEAFGDTRVIRGCGWRTGFELCRSGARQNEFTAQRRNDLGLRAARSVPLP